MKPLKDFQAVGTAGWLVRCPSIKRWNLQELTASKTKKAGRAVRSVATGCGDGRTLQVGCWKPEPYRSLSPYPDALNDLLTAPSAALRVRCAIHWPRSRARVRALRDKHARRSRPVMPRCSDLFAEGGIKGVDLTVWW